MPLETTPQNNPPTAGKSAGTDAPKPSVREQFMNRLSAERGPESKPPQVVKEQPVRNEERQEAEPQVDDTVADETEDRNLEQESDDLPLTEESDDQPEGEGKVEALEVDGRRYTAEEVKELVDARKQYDADYRRKTQVLARHRQEYQTHSEELAGVSTFFENLSKAQLEQIDKVDPATLTQEQFAQWKNQRQAMYSGSQQLQQSIKELRTKIQERREKMLNDQAAESVEVIKGIDKRWNNEFYGKVRDYAVKTKRYSPQEFADITDWRTMEGMIALYDRDTISEKVKPKRDNPEPPRKQRSSSPQPGRRNAQGQFESAKTAVLKSPNARQDGSFREMKTRQLLAERQGKR